MVYTMKDICIQTGLSYETLKYYCNEGLIPYVKRDKSNRRIFDEQDLAWTKDLVCLKRCNLSIQEMKNYLALCLEGRTSIPIRQAFLAEKRKQLLKEIELLNASLDYIDWKQKLYENVVSGKIEYRSNLVGREKD